jgi:dTDP-4-dehydrorhamnose 3,5-epimerase
MSISNRFEFEDTPLAGLRVIHRKVIEDQRGSFERLFCESELSALLGDKRLSQINRSTNKSIGTVRGLHFQTEAFSETKIVTCLQGEIFDVAVDIRRSSPTFLKWFGVKLSALNGLSLLIPEGFAHGFQVLQPDSQVLYCHTAPYSAEHQGAINALDPMININWPIPVSVRSERDQTLPLLERSFDGV